MNWLLVSQIITSVCGFIWTILLARYLGVGKKKLAVVGTSLIDSRFGSGVELILGSSSEEENLAYLKKKIDEQFIGRKVVCIIDDLDRLSKRG